MSAPAGVAQRTHAPRPALNDRWMSRARCREVKAEFHAENMADTQHAKRVCNTGCPVKDECLEYAMERNEQLGVWGGMSIDDRKRLRRERRAVNG